MQKSVLEYLEKSIERYKDKIAVIDSKGRTTFQEVGVYSKRLAVIISKVRESAKKPVCVYLPKSAESLIAFMGILYSDNFYVPLDINSPEIRLKNIIGDLENPLIITSRKYTDTLVSIGIPYNNIIIIEDIYCEDIIYDNNSLIRKLDAMLDIDPIYIIYTSGSTGKPKGVVISHRSVIDYIDWAVECFGISSHEIIGNQSPFYFDNSTLDIYLCIATGATLVIIPEQHFAFPVKLMEYVVSQNINFLFWVPSVMINIANTKALDVIDASCLRKILFAGEVMPNKHLNYWRERLSDALYANLYGPTEITVDCTYYIVNRKFEDNDPLPIGVPCRNTDVLILNEDDKPAEKGEIGELCVRGTSLALGYWKDFDKSNKVFMQNPLNKNYFDKIYRTGDLVYINEYDEIIFTGRRDSQIKHFGYRIELGEIEKAALSLKNIKNACVIYNGLCKRIELVYESREEISPMNIRAGLMRLLPKYMIPHCLHRVEELPLNANGKIDRVLLKSQYAK